MNTNQQNRKWGLLFVAWVISLVAMGGSLYFSEIRGFIPCNLCWYQRIAMYPLVLIFLVALFPLEMRVIKFTAPLVLVGWLISIYHNLLQLNIVTAVIDTCKVGVPCSSRYVNWWGFITIPMLSFMAFTLILFLLFTLLVNRSR